MIPGNTKGNPFQSPNAVAEEPSIVEGHTVSLTLRVLGLISFCVSVPLFVWYELEEPSFSDGSVDVSDAVWLFLLLAMAWATLSIGVFGHFVKTRISRTDIRWGLFFRRRLYLADVDYVHSVSYPPPVLRVVSKAGKRIEIPGGTEALYEAFLRLQARYPHPASQPS